MESIFGSVLCLLSGNVFNAAVQSLSADIAFHLVGFSKENAVTYIPLKDKCGHIFHHRCTDNIEQACLLFIYLLELLIFCENPAWQGLDFQGPRLDVFSQLLLVSEDLSHILDHITPGRSVLAPPRHNLHVLTRNQFD